MTDLDLSAHALAGSKRNFTLNESLETVRACSHELMRADAFDWLAANPGLKYDLIILDPPSLAKRQSERNGALDAYLKLASLSIKHLLPNGILIACSCSAHVSAEEFFGNVRQAAVSCGRKYVELRTTGHAPDHPATFKEADYLKAIYLRLT